MNKISQTIDALNNRGFSAKAFETMAEAKQEILGLIKKEDSVTTGGSMTLIDSGLLTDLDDRGNAMFSTEVHPPKTPEERISIRRQGAHGPTGC